MPSPSCLSFGGPYSVLGWLTAALFIPSLALALGTLTSLNKPFEAIFVIWIYILTQKYHRLDFAGLTALHLPAALSRISNLRNHGETKAVEAELGELPAPYPGMRNAST